MNKIYFLITLFISQHVYAQPYIDLAAARYEASPDAGIFRRGFEPNYFTYGSAGLNIPILFKDSSVLVLSPTVEKWDIKSPGLFDVQTIFKGIATQLAFVKPLNNVWTATVAFNPRWNGETYSFKNKLLPAGAVLLGHKLSNTFTYKFGLYYHKEYYGNIFVPLFGIDWRINNTLNLFGILPGNLVLEKKVSRSFYYGASFRAATASYEYGPLKKFLRVDENEVQAFADVYFSKHLVLTAEAGHSVFRRFRTGTPNNRKKYETKEKFNDDLLFRISVQYRLRF